MESINKKSLEEKLALLTDECATAIDQINKWSVIANRKEGAINTIQQMLKEMEGEENETKEELNKK